MWPLRPCTKHRAETLVLYGRGSDHRYHSGVARVRMRSFKSRRVLHQLYTVIQGYHKRRYTVPARVFSQLTYSCLCTHKHSLDGQISQFIVITFSLFIGYMISYCDIPSKTCVIPSKPQSQVAVPMKTIDLIDLIDASDSSFSHFHYGGSPWEAPGPSFAAAPVLNGHARIAWHMVESLVKMAKKATSYN